jgi:cytosolic carboxypeptidase protein 2/3
MKRKYGGYYSSLSFTLKLEHDNDTVYIAHCYPYTYTRLLKFLKGLENDPIKKHRFQRKFLCLTESGNK